jgi:hypothetical protein
MKMVITSTGVWYWWLLLCSVSGLFWRAREAMNSFVGGAVQLQTCKATSSISPEQIAGAWADGCAAVSSWQFQPATVTLFDLSTVSILSTRSYFAAFKDCCMNIMCTCIPATENTCSFHDDLTEPHVMARRLHCLS